MVKFVHFYHCAIGCAGGWFVRPDTDIFTVAFALAKCHAHDDRMCLDCSPFLCFACLDKVLKCEGTVNVFRDIVLNYYMTYEAPYYITN